MTEPTTTSKLRNHFTTAYGLQEDQVEAMVKSASSSLCTVFAKVDALFKEGENLTEIAQLSHNLKGLLMNMGEQEWAKAASEMEALAKKGTPYNYEAEFMRVFEGMEEIIRYND